MMLRVAPFVLLVLSIPGSPVQAASAPVPAKPALAVEAKALDAHRVQLTIGTNLPLPLKVATSIDLRGQRPEDVYIGYDQFVMLTGTKTVVVLDTSKSRTPLPSATYNATVDFYPTWKENILAKMLPRLHTETQVHLIGSGNSAAGAARLNERQRWVMSNVIQDSPWNRATFEQRLGKSIKGRSNLSHLHDAYYFPGADMTMLVNRLQSRVTTWDKGNTIALPNATKIDYERRGLKWPLTVDTGYLECEGNAVWFATPDGATFAVNGVARGRYRSIEPIWLTNGKLMSELKAAGATGPTVRIDMSDLIDEGLKHCSK